MSTLGTGETPEIRYVQKRVVSWDWCPSLQCTREGPWRRVSGSSLMTSAVSKRLMPEARRLGSSIPCPTLSYRSTGRECGQAGRNYLCAWGLYVSHVSAAAA